MGMNTEDLFVESKNYHLIRGAKDPTLVFTVERIYMTNMHCQNAHNFLRYFPNEI